MKTKSVREIAVQRAAAKGLAAAVCMAGIFINGSALAQQANTQSQTSPAIENLDIAEQHFLVQVDQSLHQRTVEAVRSLVSAPSAGAAPNLDAGQFKPVARDRTTDLKRLPVDQIHLSLADAR